MYLLYSTLTLWWRPFGYYKNISVLVCPAKNRLSRAPPYPAWPCDGDITPHHNSSWYPRRRCKACVAKNMLQNCGGGSFFSRRDWVEWTLNYGGSVGAMHIVPNNGFVVEARSGWGDVVCWNRRVYLSCLVSSIQKIDSIVVSVDFLPKETAGSGTVVFDGKTIAIPLIINRNVESTPHHRGPKSQ